MEANIEKKNDFIIRLFSFINLSSNFYFLIVFIIIIGINEKVKQEKTIKVIIYSFLKFYL